MEGTNRGGAAETAITKFLDSKAAPVIGLILAFVIGILLYWRHFQATCCIGFLFIGIILFVVPKIFNCNKWKVLVTFGIVFFLAATAIGAFAFSKPCLDNNTNTDEYNSGGFSHVQFVEQPDGKYVVTVKYEGTGTDLMVMVRSTRMCYDFYAYGYVDDNKFQLTPTAGGYYISTPFDFKKSNDVSGVYSYAFTYKEGDQTKITNSSVAVVSGYNETMYILHSNGYNVFMSVLMFMIIVLFTELSRRSLEKTRAKMEAEGRLYPKGYGRCKQCGSIVLPGETTCRKCGTYIDVPDELRVKKVDFFECSECGAEVPADANICPKCGAKFDEDDDTVIESKDAQVSEEDTFECSECGAQVPADAEFCPKCGAKFDKD